MKEYPVRGKVRFRPENFEQDYHFVKVRVAEISKPELKSEAGLQVQFWGADFSNLQTMV